MKSGKHKNLLMSHMAVEKSAVEIYDWKSFLKKAGTSNTMTEKKKKKKNLIIVHHFLRFIDKAMSLTFHLKHNFFPANFYEIFSTFFHNFLSDFNQKIKKDFSSDQFYW